MKEPFWIPREAVLALHDELLTRFGGSEGLRDEGMLDSALHRPCQLFAYEDPSLARMAAAYAGGIVRNHPFVDGNKRTGFMTAYTFLGINGLRLAAPEEEAVLQTLGLAAGEIAEEAYREWLAQHCEPEAPST